MARKLKFGSILKTAQAKKAAGDSLSYRERTTISVVKQGESRGIPAEEAPAFVADVEEQVGAPFCEWDDRFLLEFNRNLPGLFVLYLGGAKRR